MDLMPYDAFDVIYHKNVLSHLHDPIHIFKQSYARLKKDGIMVFVTGNGGNLSEKWLKRVGELGYPEHLFLFSNKALGLLIERTGFTVEKYYIIPKLREVLRYIRPKRKKSKKGGSIIQRTDFEYSLKDKIRGMVSHIINHWISRLLPKRFPSNIILFLRKT